MGRPPLSRFFKYKDMKSFKVVNKYTSFFMLQRHCFSFLILVANKSIRFLIRQFE